MSAERKQYPIPGPEFPILAGNKTTKELALLGYENVAELLAENPQVDRRPRGLKTMMFLNEKILNPIFTIMDFMSRDDIAKKIQEAERVPRKNIIFTGKTATEK